jgi:hypothetical protein
LTGIKMQDGDMSAPTESYPRTTSLDFLARCRDRTAAFYRYWDGKRRGRLMPSRADIEPLEMKAWLAGTALIQVTRDPAAPNGYALRYRLIGSRPTILRSKDVTGMRVETGYFGASLEAALENYRLVIEEKTLVYDWDHTPAADGYAREAETLLLPLSTDGETVDMVLVYQEVDTLR